LGEGIQKRVAKEWTQRQDEALWKGSEECRRPIQMEMSVADMTV